MGEIKETNDTNSTIKSSIAQDLMLPFRILISPVKTFKQLAVKPTAKGLLSLVALIIVISAIEWYAYAAKIVLVMEGQPVDFIVTGDFSNWFLSIMSIVPISVAVYWLVSAAGLTLISRYSFKGSKVISLRASFVVFGYLLSVLIVLYAVRAAVFLALPRIPFQTSTLPGATEVWLAHTQSWNLFPFVQLGLACAGFVWLVLLGTIAINAMHEISWFKAGMMSLLGFLITLTLFGFP